MTSASKVSYTAPAASVSTPAFEVPPGANQVATQLSVSEAAPVVAPNPDAELPGVSSDGLKVAPNLNATKPK